MVEVYNIVHYVTPPQEGPETAQINIYITKPMNIHMEQDKDYK